MVVVVSVVVVVVRVDCVILRSLLDGQRRRCKTFLGFGLKERLSHSSRSLRRAATEVESFAWLCFAMLALLCSALLCIACIALLCFAH